MGKPDTGKPAVEHAGNVWDRSRQCTAQAEKVAKPLETLHTPDVIFMGWENHYSPKYERCFVHVSYQNPKALADPHLGLPVFYDELSDAFENRMLATAPTITVGVPNTSIICSITDGATQVSFDCAAARAYIDERMNR